jgi:hypothetical protein
MNRYVRKTLKGLLWVVGIVILLIVLQISVLAFPHPWFNQSVRDGNLTIYSDESANPELESIFRGVRERIQAVEIYDETVNLRVFVCNNQGLYNVFARLALVPTFVPGFNLSIFNNSFVSVETLKNRRYTNRAGIRHSALAGDLEQSIAHELVHDYTQERIGFFTYRKMPTWKTEGYAEYSASRLQLEQDTDEPLAVRITRMQTALTDTRAHDYYRWGLVVEFLSVELNYAFDDIFAAKTTLDDSISQMMAWYNNQSSSPTATYR